MDPDAIDALGQLQRRCGCDMCVSPRTCARRGSSERVACFAAQLWSGNSCGSACGPPAGARQSPAAGRPSRARSLSEVRPYFRPRAMPSSTNVWRSDGDIASHDSRQCWRTRSQSRDSNRWREASPKAANGAWRITSVMEERIPMRCPEYPSVGWMRRRGGGPVLRGARQVALLRAPGGGEEDRGRVGSPRSFAAAR